MQRIYCVEDDEDIRELVLYALKSSGFEVEEFSTASAFENTIDVSMPDLILLDIMLPDKDGIEILRELRRKQNTKNIPVILLTAKSTESDKVRGFDMGADDYVTKPFSVLELISRIKAVLKRSGNIGEIAAHDGIRVDENSRIAYVNNEPISLTYKEFELLLELMKHTGSVIAREKLLNKIWGYHFEGESRTLDVHIGSLRRKLGEKGSHIETIRNVGYKFK